MKQGWIQVNNNGIKEPLAPKTLADMVYVDEAENKTILDKMVPTNHATTKTTYGVASSTNYGHAIGAAATDMPLIGNADGHAGSPFSGKYANWNHRHPYDDRLRSTGEAPVTYVCNDTYFYPNTTAVANLGGSNNRWKGVYSVNADNISSDERQKKDIQAIDEAAQLIMGIEPVKYRRIDDSENLHYGFIAQQVKATLEKIGIQERMIYTRDSIDEDIPEETATEDQVTYALAYTELIAPLVAMVQQQQQQLSDLGRRLAELESSRS